MSHVELNNDGMCRSCLTRGEFKSVFSEINLHKGVRLSEMLMACTTVKAIKGDGLPESICDDCIMELNQAYTFKQRCEKSDLYLRTRNFSNEPVRTNEGRTYIIYVDSENCDLKGESDIKQEEVILDYDAEYLEENEIENVLTSENLQDNEIYVEEVDQFTDVMDTENFDQENYTESIYSCAVCPLKFHTQNHLEEHVKALHPLQRTTKCPDCNKHVPSTKMAAHMRSHISGKPHCCEFCGFSFSTERTLKRHVMTHTTEQIYRCEYCDKRFLQKESLEKHLRVHTHERPFSCTKCSCAFKQETTLKKHMKRHAEDNNETSEVESPKSKESPFLCSHCGKNFTSNVQLQNHIRTHTGEKPFACNYCGRAFAHYSSLQAHIRTHTGEKPYVCKFCNRAFTQHNHLVYHTRTHSQEKPYECEFCGKCFAVNGNLTVHLRIHTGEKPFVCPVCNKGFYDSSSMKKHKKKHCDKPEID